MRLVWTFLTVLALPSIALACSCASSGGCPGSGGGKGPLFLGTVLSIKDLPPSDEPQFLSNRSIRLRVDEAFQGITPGLREIEIWTGTGLGDCGISPQVGEVYLIDAYPGKDGTPRTSTCSDTRRFQHAGPALRILRDRRAGKRIPSFTGALTVGPEPLANIVMRVKADGKSYETRSDAQGRYEFFDLPPGKFDFAPEEPPGTSLAWNGRSDYVPEPHTLTAGGCGENNIQLYWTASLRGRILDSSNKVLPNAALYLIPADGKKLPDKNESSSEHSGPDGYFRFLNLKPGRYVLVVNPDDANEPLLPYRRTFYPGVPDRESAGIITIGPGEQIKDLDLQLGEPFATRKFEVQVVWSDGSPVDGVELAGKPTTNSAAAVSIQRAGFDQGSFNVKVNVDESYQFQAYLACYSIAIPNGPSAVLTSNVFDLDRKDAPAKVSMTIPAKSCP